MKKKAVLTILILITLAFALIGCASSSEKDIPDLQDKSGWLLSDVYSFSDLSLLDVDTFGNSPVAYKEKYIVVKPGFENTLPAYDYTNTTITRPIVETFGYFNMNLTLPTAPGVWAEVSLTAKSSRNIGNNGKDGSEIAIIKSLHPASNSIKTTVKYDTASIYERMLSKTCTPSVNVYDGKPHNFSFLWTPHFYSLFIDGEKMWESDFGGTSTVQQMLKIQVKTADSKGYSDCGVKIGKFDEKNGAGNNLLLSSISTYKNLSYQEYVKQVALYNDQQFFYNATLIAINIAIGLISLHIVYVLIKKYIKYKKEFI